MQRRAKSSYYKRHPVEPPYPISSSQRKIGQGSGSRTNPPPNPENSIWVVRTRRLPCHQYHRNSHQPWLCRRSGIARQSMKGEESHIYQLTGNDSLAQQEIPWRDEEPALLYPQIQRVGSWGNDCCQLFLCRGVGTGSLLLELCYPWQILHIPHLHSILRRCSRRLGSVLICFEILTTEPLYSGYSTMTSNFRRVSPATVGNLQDVEVRDEQVCRVTFRWQGTSFWSCQNSVVR